VCQVEKITTELEHKDQKAQNELNRIEFERERRRVIKEVRTEAHALSAARKKKADDFRKQRVRSCPPSLPPSLSLPSPHVVAVADLGEHPKEEREIRSHQNWREDPALDD
jgi:hypothetical protein